jgi:integrase/recombinase XerC
MPVRACLRETRRRTGCGPVLGTGWMRMTGLDRGPSCPGSPARRNSARERLLDAAATGHSSDGPNGPLRHSSCGAINVVPTCANSYKSCIMVLMHDTGIGTFVDEFLAARATRKPSVHTLAAYRRDLALVLQLAQPAPVTVSDLSPRVLRSAFARFAADRAPASVSRAWSSWNAFFTFLVTEGVVAGNPMSAVDKPRQVALSPKPLRGEDTPEMLLRTVSTADERQRDPWPERDLLVLALALCAGLRLSEMLALRVGAVSGRDGERRIDVAGKGGRPRVVPIDSGLDAAVGRYLDSRRSRFGRSQPTSPLLVDRQGAALQRGGLQCLVRSCYRRAGVGDRVPRGAQLHALRHTFATRLAEDGANASEIMRLMGHASLATSQSYIEVTADAQRAAVRANRTNRVLRDLS